MKPPAFTTKYMMDHVKKTLADPGKVHPAYNAKDGYELAGFVWFQGWNDMVDSGTYPNRSQPGGYAQIQRSPRPLHPRRPQGSLRP